MKVKHNAKRLIQNLTGLSITRYRDNFGESRNSLIRRVCPDLVIDCGANSGQWGSALKHEFPELKMVSFEPVFTEFQKLQSECQKYEYWDAIQVAVSSKSGTEKINFASNQGMSSSLNRPLLHTSVHPNVDFSVGESVSISTLDEFEFEARKIFLKIDIQGHESSALEGARNTMRSVALIEIESSFTPLYEFETPHHQLIQRLTSMGFIPFDFGNVHRDESGRVWQIDTLLIKSDFL
jgi:FkbM family methyltransferase